MTTLRRIVRQIVAPNGKHRPKPVLLPDEPIPAPDGPIRGAVLCEDELARLLDEDAATPTECAPCPCCDRTMPHAMNRDGTRRCFACGTTSKGDQ